MIYRRFLVRDNDHFIPFEFQQVELEIENINTELSRFSADGKAEMLISYCKNGSIRTEDANAYPELASRVETLSVTTIAELFKCCADNIVFSQELEKHINEQVNTLVKA